MKKIIVITFLIALLSGCATFPPPKISDNHYQNYKYGFTLDMPGGEWKVSKTVPKWFQKVIKASPELLLFNNTIGGALAIICNKSTIEIFPKEDDSPFWQAYRASLRDSARKEIQEQIKKGEDAKKTNPSVTLFTHEARNLYSSPEMTWFFRIETDNEMLKMGFMSRSYIYPLENATSYVDIWIGYLRANQEEVFRTLYKLIESFKYGDEYSKVGE